MKQTGTALVTRREKKPIPNTCLNTPTTKNPRDYMTTCTCTDSKRREYKYMLNFVSHILCYNYAKTLVKIQVTAIFQMQDMRRSFSPKFIEICMETPCWCPSGWAPTWRPVPTGTSLTEFCYKSVNLSFEKLKHNKIILFPIQVLFG